MRPAAMRAVSHYALGYGGVTSAGDPDLSRQSTDAEFVLKRRWESNRRCYAAIDESGLAGHRALLVAKTQ